MGELLLYSFFLSINIFQPSLKLMLNFDYSEWVTVIFFAQMLAIIFLGSPASYRIFFSAWRLLPSSDATLTLAQLLSQLIKPPITWKCTSKSSISARTLFIYICISSIGLFFHLVDAFVHCKIDSYVHQNASAFIDLDVSVYLMYAYRCIYSCRFICSPRCIFPYRCISSFRKILFI